MVAERRAKDSLKSTWRTADKWTWGRHQWTIHLLGINPTDINKEVPVHQKTDKMPYLSHWETNKWVLAHALWPIAVHQLFVMVAGYNLNPLLAFIWYTIVFQINAVHELRAMRQLGMKYGFLDGDKHARDQVPDVSIDSIMRSLVSTATARPMMATFLAYRTSQSPSFSWLLPIEIGLYTLTLDFWFYWYHRVMHEVDSLWRYHRTHHLTKHPTPLLTLFADYEQEIFDIAIIPLMTYGTLKLMGFPMGFYDWWMCHQYIVWTELWGHSGLRLYVRPPTPISPFLAVTGTELCTEDHDLHHRMGWKQSHNYGKQTRFWDVLFGTSHPRIESIEGVIDWDTPAKLPVLRI